MAVGRVLVQFASFSEDLQDLLRALAGQQKTDAAYSTGLCQLPASVAISRGKLVNISGGQLRLADKDLAYPADGIALSSGAAGNPVYYLLLAGYVDKLPVMVAGTTYWLGNAGSLLNAAPGAGLKQSVGRALSTAEFLLSITYP